MKRAIAAAVLLLLFGCDVEQPPKPPGPPKKPFVLPPASDDAERSSLVNLGHGSVVVHRSGEVVLEMSAMAAADGDPATFWGNLPKDYPQSLDIALAAPARIDKVGVRTPAKPYLVAKEIVFETSMDGRTFQPLATMRPKAQDEPQWMDVKPADAAFLRVTLPEPMVANGQVMVSSILAQGHELAPARPGRISGSWLINGRAAEFSETGGTMQYAHSQLHFEGGSNGRVYRFEWIRGPEFGYAIFAVSPDGKHLNGVQWHEEIIPLFFGDAWFGERTAGLLPMSKVDVAREFLRHTGRHSLYDLSGEGLKSLIRLLKTAKNPRLVAHEFREKTPEANRARAQRALDSLAKALQNAGVTLNGVTLVAAGSDNARQIPGSEAARELYSTIDLEVGR
ncbi:MAG TPA: discoidin domain-containing protein [Thermoanaerobaculia bacterium]|nr:discoidin domain-containing protein [Thermoanaerobaculia bacterium]